MTAIAADAVIRRRDQLVFRELPEGAGLLDLRTSEFYALNRTGALIWEAIAGGPTFAELAPAVTAAVAGAPADLEAEIAGFLGELVRRRLIEIVTPPG